MNIGVDIDGVILDFQDRIRVYAEWYDLEIFKKKGPKKKDEIKVWKRYDWNKEEVDKFVNETFLKVAKESNIVCFSQKILERLKQEKNRIVIITTRGDFAGSEMINIAKEQLELNNIKYDKIYWNAPNKVEICKREKIDFMIDDYADICEKLSKEKIRTIYFRAKDNRKLPESYYLKEVSNWVEIYRFIKNNNKVEMDKKKC